MSLFFSLFLWFNLFLSLSLLLLLSFSLSHPSPPFGCQTFQWFSTFRHPEGCSGEKNSLPILFLQKKFQNLQHCLLSPLPLFGSRHDVCQLSIWSLSLSGGLSFSPSMFDCRMNTHTHTHLYTLAHTCTYSRTLTLTCTHYRTLTHTQTLLNFVLKGCEGFRRKKIRSNKSVWFRLWKIIKHSQSWQISASEFHPKLTPRICFIKFQTLLQ